LTPALGEAFFFVLGLSGFFLEGGLTPAVLSARAHEIRA